MTTNRSFHCIIGNTKGAHIRISAFGYLLKPIFVERQSNARSLSGFSMPCPVLLSAGNSHTYPALGCNILPKRILRIRHRTISRDNGIEKAFSSPPFGLGMKRCLVAKSGCSAIAFLIGSGRLPDSSRNRCSSRLTGLSMAHNCSNQRRIWRGPRPLLRRFSGFHSTAKTGFSRGMCDAVLRA